MRKSLLWILLLTAVLLGRPVSAQGPLEIDKMEVDIWPEYDRPDVLVIYHLTLPAATTLPTEVNLRIPVQAGEPFNVAVRNTDGNLYVVDYTRTVEGEWARITFSSPQPDIQFEYYDPNLVKDGAGRSFTYRWPGDYAVNDLAIQVQQPVGGSDMQLSPNLGAGLAGSDGLTYYNARIGEVPANSPFEVSMQYQKSDDALSVQTVKVEPAGTISPETAGRFDMTRYIPYILGALGLILVAGGVIWYFQSQRRPEVVPARRRHTGTEKASQSGDNDGDTYCPQCGRRAGPGDRFCRTCGTELRA